MDSSTGLVDPKGEIIYPDSDGMPMAETEVHALELTNLWATLKHNFRLRKDVYVVGNILLYVEEGNPGNRRSPDIMVVKGIDASYPRRSFKLWEENAAPCVVIELTSKETDDEDSGPKKALYQRLGVKEYFLFDPLHEYLERSLIGYRLIPRAENGNGENGEVVTEYEELQPDSQGALVSHELGLRLVPEGVNLALFVYGTRERLLAPPEAYEALEEIHRLLETERQRTEDLQKQVKDQTQRADNEKKRADALLARLLELLPPGTTLREEG
jgi:Uma2 family endonuclease